MDTAAIEAYVRREYFHDGVTGAASYACRAAWWGRSGGIGRPPGSAAQLMAVLGLGA